MESDARKDDGKTYVSMYICAYVRCTVADHPRNRGMKAIYIERAIPSSVLQSHRPTIAARCSPWSTERAIPARHGAPRADGRREFLCVGLAEADQLSALQPPAPHHRIDAVQGEDHAARLVVISREGLAVPMKVCPVQRPGWFVTLASIEEHEQ